MLPRAIRFADAPRAAPYRLRRFRFFRGTMYFSPHGSPACAGPVHRRTGQGIRRLGLSFQNDSARRRIPKTDAGPSAGSPAQPRRPPGSGFFCRKRCVRRFFSASAFLCKARRMKQADFPVLCRAEASVFSAAGGRFRVGPGRQNPARRPFFRSKAQTCVAKRAISKSKIPRKRPVSGGFFGAGNGNRTHLHSLEGCYTSRCTIPAITGVLYHIFWGLSSGRACFSVPSRRSIQSFPK